MLFLLVDEADHVPFVDIEHEFPVSNYSVDYKVSAFRAGGAGPNPVIYEDSFALAIDFK